MSPRSKKKRPVPSALGWAFLALFVLVTVLAFLWVVRPIYRPKSRPRVSPSPPAKPSLPVVKQPIFKQPILKRPKPSPLKPLVAIIIDDMGQNPRLERKFFELGLPLTFSFLPYAPFTKKLAREAHSRGFEVMVHIPLEAQNHQYTPGLIQLDMSEGRVKYLVRQAILAVPYAVGVNHHMGSLFTEDKLHVRWLLEAVAAEGLFYIDSRTTKNTVVPVVARELGLPFAERRVFLDHTLADREIEHSFRILVKKARKEGRLVAIGHPHPQTLKALKRTKVWLTEEVLLVPASKIVRRP